MWHNSQHIFFFTKLRRSELARRWQESKSIKRSARCSRGVSSYKRQTNLKCSKPRILFMLKTLSLIFRNRAISRLWNIRCSQEQVHMTFLKISRLKASTSHRAVTKSFGPIMSCKKKIAFFLRFSIQTVRFQQKLWDIIKSGRHLARDSNRRV